MRQTNKDDLSILHHNEQKTYFIASFLLVQNRQRTAGVIGVSISKIYKTRMLLLKFPFCDRLSVFFSDVFFGTKNNHALYFSTKGRELYYFLSYFWSLIAVFANEVRAHEVLVVFFIHGLTKTVSLFLLGDKIIKDGQPAMQNAITTKIFKAPVC